SEGALLFGGALDTFFLESSPFLLLGEIFPPTVWRPPVGSFHHIIHESSSIALASARLRLGVLGSSQNGFGSASSPFVLASARRPRLQPERLRLSLFAVRIGFGSSSSAQP